MSVYRQQDFVCASCRWLLCFSKEQAGAGAGAGVLTCPVGVALAEGSISEAHGAVADNDKAWQAVKQRIVH